MLCKDKLVNFLKKYGYNLMSLPKEDIRPLDVFTHNGGALEKMGNIQHILVPGMDILPYPTIKENLHTASISQMQSDSVGTKLGIGLLSNILTGMGVETLELSVHFGKANSLTFQFNDVFEDKVELLELDAFLSAAKLSNVGNNTRKLMENNALYIITSVLKSNSISIHTSGKISGGAMQNIFQGDVEVSCETETTSDISFKGKKQLVFGFRAIRLFFEDGFYSAYDIAADVVGRNIDASEDESRAQYEMEDAFIDL